jgi:hypothetical protein
MKKGLIKEAFRLQQIAGIKPVNEIFGDANPDALRLEEDTVRKYFETMVEVQPETIVSILTQLLTEELPFNQFIKDTVEDIQDSYRDELGESNLGAAYAERELDGDASRQMHEEEGQEGRQYIKITGGSRGEIEDVEILYIPGNPDSYMQNEYDEEINRRTDNGTDEEEMENIEEFADFNKVGEGMYQMVFNSEESAAFISANLPKVKAYMKRNGYNSVESLVEYLVEEADSAEIYDFLDQIGAEGI